MAQTSKFDPAAPGAVVLVQPPARLTSGGIQPYADDLIGWREGAVTADEWLAAGGALDAPDNLPAGGCIAWESSSFNCRQHLGSVRRAGALA